MSAWQTAVAAVVVAAATDRNGWIIMQGQSCTATVVGAVLLSLNFACAPARAGWLAYLVVGLADRLAGEPACQLALLAGKTCQLAEARTIQPVGQAAGQAQSDPASQPASLAQLAWRISSKAAFAQVKATVSLTVQ